MGYGTRQEMPKLGWVQHERIILEGIESRNRPCPPTGRPHRLLHTNLYPDVRLSDRFGESMR